MKTKHLHDKVILVHRNALRDGVCNTPFEEVSTFSLTTYKGIVFSRMLAAGLPTVFPCKARGAESIVNFSTPEAAGAWVWKLREYEKCAKLTAEFDPASLLQISIGLYKDSRVISPYVSTAMAMRLASKNIAMANNVAFWADHCVHNVIPTKFFDNKSLWMRKLKDVKDCQAEATRETDSYTVQYFKKHFLDPLASLGISIPPARDNDKKLKSAWRAGVNAQGESNWAAALAMFVMLNIVAQMISLRNKCTPVAVDWNTPQENIDLINGDLYSLAVDEIAHCKTLANAHNLYVPMRVSVDEHEQVSLISVT